MKEKTTGKSGSEPKDGVDSEKETKEANDLKAAEISTILILDEAGGDLKMNRYTVK